MKNDIKNINELNEKERRIIHDYVRKQIQRVKKQKGESTNDECNLDSKNINGCNLLE
ncbi:UNVERIFIED_CONTAM: hypothetical protein Cloal_0134 [Acetivibrio alkalicellulosi]